MKLTKFQTFTLALAGITALCIGLFISIEPHAFYASYQIILPESPDLLSELRGPGTNLAALGLVMLAGLFHADFAKISSTIAITVFLAFPLGRMISIAMDGLPSEGLLMALVIEMMIGMLLLFAFCRKQTLGDVSKA